jgi:hypothetical protein
MTVLVLAIAVALGIAREFRNGVPPEFVVRGIPARIARLRPGMTRAEVREILGLDKSWVWGGTDARFDGGEGNGRGFIEVYVLGPKRFVYVISKVDGKTVVPWYKPKACIEIGFAHDRRDPSPGGSERDRLGWAKFHSDSGLNAEMPGRP